MQTFVLCLFISTKVTHGALWMSPAVCWVDRLDVSVAVKDHPITLVSFTRQCVWLTSYNTSTRWKPQKVTALNRNMRWVFYFILSCETNHFILVLQNSEYFTKNYSLFCKIKIFVILLFHFIILFFGRHVKWVTYLCIHLFILWTTCCVTNHFICCLKTVANCKNNIGNTEIIIFYYEF